MLLAYEMITQYGLIRLQKGDDHRTFCYEHTYHKANMSVAHLQPSKASPQP